MPAKDGKKSRSRRPYRKPEVQSTKIYEKRALSCMKMTSAQPSCRGAPLGVS